MESRPYIMIIDDEPPALSVRGESLEKRMSDYLIQDFSRLPNVEVRLQTEAMGCK